MEHPHADAGVATTGPAHPPPGGRSRLAARAVLELFLPSEATIQNAVSVIPDIYELANRYYVALHFPVIIAFLLWGFFARPRKEYAWARNLLIVQTSLALLIHVAFPLAPPRMFPQWGFVDTMVMFGPNAYGGASASVANQHAAMPSLHIGWAVLIAVVLVRTAPRPLALLGVGLVLFPARPGTASARPVGSPPASRQRRPGSLPPGGADDRGADGLPARPGRVRPGPGPDRHRRAPRDAAQAQCEERPHPDDRGMTFVSAGR